MKTPVIELSDCILCGVCEEVAPEIFRLNDSGFMEIADMKSYPEEEVEEAIKNCPKDCIFWEE